MKIVQISDVHFNGDYNGKFKVWNNFLMTLVDIPKDTDIVIITGDLADSEYETQYEILQNMFDSTLNGRGMHPKLYVMGGNHDDVNVMKNMFGREQFLDESKVDITLKDGFVGIDTSNGTLGEKGKEVLDNIPAGTLVFTHYPLLICPSVFMSKFMLSNIDESTDLAMERGFITFCGHFHVAWSNPLLKQYVCPSTQCQIDTDSEEFKVSSYTPGYRVIEVENGKMVKTEVKWVQPRIAHF